MKQFYNGLAAALFAVIYPFACISSSYDHKFDGMLWNYFYNYNGVFIFTRYIVIFILLFILTRMNKNNQHFLCIYIPSVMGVLTAMMLIDHLFTHHLMYNYYLSLWLCAAITVANAAVFLSATLFLKDDYRRFYRIFWFAVSGEYLYTLYISFIRSPNSFTMSVNTHIGEGTLQYFRYVLQHPGDAYMALICVGNILIFAPLPFILRNCLQKAPYWVLGAIGLLLPIAVEGYQYIFNCGNVDIDDLLLNWLGFFVGLLCEEILRHHKLEKKITSA
ncbi:MAG: VanZ family protein [Eubacterium sp.]|nr:VanZ family protein [Eubacterium sp.]